MLIEFASVVDAVRCAIVVQRGMEDRNANLPEIALGVTSGAHRLVHLHHNVPGVLASINGVLAQHGVNVEGQLLRTRDELGYVLTDIGSEYGKDVLAELRASRDSAAGLEVQRAEVGRAGRDGGDGDNPIRLLARER